MVLFISIIHILVALFMILVVLVQGGNQGGVGAAFGGGNTQGIFGAGGATSFLGKLTYGAAGIFMCTSIALVILEGNSHKTGLSDKLKEQAQEVIQSGPAPAADGTAPQSETPAAPQGESSGDPQGAVSPESAPVAAQGAAAPAAEAAPAEIAPAAESSAVPAASSSEAAPASAEPKNS